MFLAVHPGRRRVKEVADFFQISESHVAKVVNHLSRNGYILSSRGVGGGIELAKRPGEITIGAVIAAVEGTQHLLECVGKSNVCVIEQACKLKGVLAKAEQIQRDYLNSVSLQDVLPFGAPQPLVRLTFAVENLGQS